MNPDPSVAGGWIDLGAQFCLQLSFGVLLALAFVPRAPVGTLFYRLMGTTAVLPALLAGVIPVTSAGRSPSEPAVVATWLAVAAYPFYSGPLRGRRWAAALAWGLGATAVALVATLARPGDLAGLRLAVASLSAAATGAVAGGVGLAMVLGHWYLTVPKLDVRHLVRLNRVTVGAMVASLACVGLTCLVFRTDLAAARTPLLGPWGLFYLGTRIAVGLLVPLVFAWMTAGSLRYENTRSATGILYASTVLVLIGTGVAVSLQSSYGVPL
ncbi:MAG: hypothetical protein QF903_01780 [Planctomycetota bacterium]|jgi:hypothetical protein|nr:hypothetical protein [Planctomycetota bacterium]MDP6763023.1 hypothetical protein [Planctomycetota bacterium]MDP6988194.1 hypothetical protein [Planctomycetota bacterium]